MKLYRSHSEKFQETIESNNSFVCDNTRKFNDFGGWKKNMGEFYFYAGNLEGALAYSCEGDLPVYEYDAGEIRLLELRKKEDRALLTETIQFFINEDEVTRQSMLKHIKPQFQNERMKRSTTVEDVVSDNQLDSLSYWGQRATDFEAGIVMRKQLEDLGYDGVIFFETGEVDIALLKPAKFVRRIK